MGRYINCESDIKPSESGFYSVKIEHVRTVLPEYLEFDGKSWIGLDKMKQDNDEESVFWDEGETPLQQKPVFNSPFVNSNK